MLPCRMGGPVPILTMLCLPPTRAGPSAWALCCLRGPSVPGETLRSPQTLRTLARCQARVPWAVRSAPHSSASCQGPSLDCTNWH